MGASLRLWDPWHWWGHPSSPHAVREHWEQARLALEERDFPLARKHLDRCLEICPVNAEAQFLMARTCRRDGDAAAWREHLTMAESMDWLQEQILLERQLQQAASGNSWSVEQKLLEQLNHLPPEEVLILEALVSGYLNNVRYTDAIEITATWLRRHPEDWLGYLYRGRAYQGLSLFPRAIENFEEALKRHPNFLITHLWLACGSPLRAGLGALPSLHSGRAAAAGHPARPGLVSGIAGATRSAGHHGPTASAIPQRCRYLIAGGETGPGGR